ncbi:hypothetical protein IWX78_002534 [Mycetocola sp. CAN_C7]|uniref:glycosyltransferase n=1 Tax=Mycetocola sp. CAN_C7 TaxID=2787724 RepID=UPI0018CBBFC3
MASDIPAPATTVLVDVIVPVHDVTRPIRRAVESVIDGTPDGVVRVLVICHNIPEEGISRQLDGLIGPRVVLIPFNDGIRSPAGPFNHGLSIAEAPYVSIMGSDDFLEPGAMAAWIAHLRASGPDAALVPLRHQHGDLLMNPLTRWRRTQRLDPVKDRLFYRTAPLGLLRLSLVRSLGLEFTARMPVGKDMAFSARLWSAGVRIDYLKRSPAYVIGADAVSRVTTTPRPIVEAMAAVLDLVGRNWVAAAREPLRRSLVTKLLRIHVLGAVITRSTVEAWSAADVGDLRASARSVIAAAPPAVSPLSRADRSLLDSLLDEGSTAGDLVLAGERHRSASRLDQIVPRNPVRLLDRESNLVRFLLYRFDR